MLKCLQRRRQRYTVSRGLYKQLVTDSKQCLTERGERLKRFRNQEANDIGIITIAYLIITVYYRLYTMSFLNIGMFIIEVGRFY